MAIRKDPFQTHRCCETILNHWDKTCPTDGKFVRIKLGMPGYTKGDTKLVLTKINGQFNHLYHHLFTRFSTKTSSNLSIHSFHHWVCLSDVYIATRSYKLGVFPWKNGPNSFMVDLPLGKSAKSPLNPHMIPIIPSGKLTVGPWKWPIYSGN